MFLLSNSQIKLRSVLKISSAWQTSWATQMLPYRPNKCKVGIILGEGPVNVGQRIKYRSLSLGAPIHRMVIVWASWILSSKCIMAAGGRTKTYALADLEFFIWKVDWGLWKSFTVINILPVNSDSTILICDIIVCVFSSSRMFSTLATIYHSKHNQ